MFNVELKAVEVKPDTPRNEHRINLFLYDRWAEKCSFLAAGDVVTVTGPPSIVYDNPEHASDPHEHPYCLAVQGTSIVPSARSVRLHIRSPRIQNSTHSVELTSETVEMIQIPLEESQKPRRRRASEPARAASGAQDGQQGRHKRRRQASHAPDGEPEVVEYQYTPLAEVTPGNKVDYNVYAVVTRYGGMLTMQTWQTWQRQTEVIVERRPLLHATRCVAAGTLASPAEARTSTARRTTLQTSADTTRRRRSCSMCSPTTRRCSPRRCGWAT